LSRCMDGWMDPQFRVRIVLKPYLASYDTGAIDSQRLIFKAWN